MCKNFTVISFIVLKLWVTKAEKLDVCKWRVFAKPVTHYTIANDKSCDSYIL